jgi:FtsP/CotA-like multicopper oxidase with cupredoxin domain
MARRLSACALLALALLSVLGAASHGRNTTSPTPGTLIVANDNRVSGGKLRHDTLSISLEARTGQWQPEGEKGRSLEAAAWAEAGKPMQNPGPLIRVPAGTVVHAALRNTLAKPLTVYGFGVTRGVTDSVIIEPGLSREVHFTATQPGTYYYAGKVIPGPLPARLDEDTQLNGVIIVDSAGSPKTPADQVFVISWYFTLDSASKTGLGHGTMSINGLSWPHTPRLDYQQGDSVSWRVVNMTAIDHPMHLHGFYFRMDAKGDGIRDTVYAPDDRRMAVTEVLDPFETMALAWSPTRPGNWIYHCHFAGHLSHLVALDTESGVDQPDSMAQMRHPSDQPHQMYGLVLGIRVAPRGTPTPSTGEARPIRLIVRSKPNVYGSEPGYAFVLGGSPEEADTDAMPVPGPTLVLEKGQPVAVTIVNQTHDRAAVHWHGIELESFPDGVPGWSGVGKDILPSIAPADSYTVRFTPPRAGTFMYHSHFNEFRQITSGLYGPLIVLEPGQKFDPETDRILMFSDGGPTKNVITGPFPPAFMNGSATPGPIQLRAGVNYRFRVIGISGDTPHWLALTQDGKPIEWRAVAKDGADLPTHQAVMRPAQLVFDPGEIYDFQYTPSAAGQLDLQFGPPAFLKIPGSKLTSVPVSISAASGSSGGGGS